MSSNTELGSFGGTNCERDFVEAPSQMLEEWCYRPISLKMMSINITDEIIDKIINKRNMLQGYFYARQLSFGLYDMALHSEFVNDNFGNNANENIAKMYCDILSDVAGVSPVENTNMITSFGHVMRGYAAGYYGYLWSEVYAKDMFLTKFYDHELDPTVGLEYKKEILSYGGSRDSMKSLRIFLGREPSNEAFVTQFN
jgi:Zn-dependent oligopeptidase